MNSPNINKLNDIIDLTSVKGHNLVPKPSATIVPFILYLHLSNIDIIIAQLYLSIN